MSMRAVPFYCPYCGESDLKPWEGGWYCDVCDRSFELRFLGLGSPELSAEEGRS